MLTGSTAIVTGGGQGLGRAIALELAARGANIVINGRTESTLASVVAEVRERGGDAVAITGSVAIRDDARRTVDAAVDTFGGVDVLVNNAQAQAAATQAIAELEDATLDVYFDSGARGTLYMMQACYPIMRDRGGGSVVNLGSSTGLTGDPKVGAYAMTKEAIRALSRVAAREWGRDNIRVNVICPAALTTAAEGFRDAHPEAFERMLKTVPLRRMGDETEDIAGAVAALVSPDFQYLTGATLVLDGGRLLFP